MGREIKRVPLDFDAPLKRTWEGYINPYYRDHCRECHYCGRTGLNPDTRKLFDSWYGFDELREFGVRKGWRFELTQDEVDALNEKKTGSWI